MLFGESLTARLTVPPYLGVREVDAEVDETAVDGAPVVVEVVFVEEHAANSVEQDRRCCYSSTCF